MGGERRVVGVGVLLSILLGWMLINSYGWLYAVPAALFFWMTGTWLGRELVKADPYALDIWIRHNRYRKYYPPSAHHAAMVPQVKDFI
jgi:type IV secretory pathway TrbD component